MYLGELKQPVSRLSGIGPKASSALASLGIFTISDLLTHYPRTREDRMHLVPLSACSDGKTVTINTPATVTAQDYFGWGAKKTLKVNIEDSSGTPGVLACFGRNFLADKLTVGTRLLIYGQFQYRYNEFQSSSFEFETVPEDYSGPLTRRQGTSEVISAPFSSSFGRMLPVYPLSAGLSQKIIRKAVSHALEQWAFNIETELPAEIISRQNLLPKNEALVSAHFPETAVILEKALLSLKFEELFHFQFAAFRRSWRRKNAAAAKSQPAAGSARTGADPAGKKGLEQRLIQSLPFDLTAGQEKALAGIRSDIRSPGPMSRLLQGDVGSGKTLVAFAAALNSIEAGGQAALMVPTELLARQHADNADRLLSPLGLRVALLTGSVKSERKELLLRALAKGEIDLIIGTHALFSSNVEFKNLSLIIIDEQHRFGVVQRTALSEKNITADILLMTATPIPRTLALTVFGDMEVSVIEGLPPGRIEVETHLAAIGKEQKVYDFVKNELEKGRQAYFVYPLISRSDRISLKDAESMFESLRDDIFKGFSIGLIHSRMDENTKKQVMDDFRDNRIQILASTSVIEVGVDVPNASCMIIEHAERFGLSAMHQLRGRVGRGTHQSYAFLVYDPELTESGTARLRIMKESTDGFLIAEEDLKIRGPGNLNGIEQSGFLPFSIADLNTDFEILKTARTEASALAEQDPGLLDPGSSSLRKLLETCPPFTDLPGGD